MAKRYNEDFQPLLMEGDTARIFGAGIHTDGMDVRCIAVGAMPAYTKNFGALTAATWSSDNEDTSLEMGKMELGQFRMMVKANTGHVELRLKNPAAVSQWRSARANWHLPTFPFDDAPFMQQFYWAQSEFFVYEDTTPRFDLYSSTTTTTTYVSFHGWRFKLEKISTKGRIDIWISEWPSQSRGAR